MATPRAIIVKEHGTNCEEESKHAFERAGARAEIVHMEDLIRNKRLLWGYQIMMFPGGFSYGDDTGSGMAQANRLRNNLEDEILAFLAQDRLVLGVCNGFQVMVNLGILPRLTGKLIPQTALTHNDSARYLDRWVDLRMSGKSPWARGLDRISMPIAHGEGRFCADAEMLRTLNEKGLIAARYVSGEMCEYLDLPANPNGSVEDIAAITDESGRVLGMMPHPERATDACMRPNWYLTREISRRACLEPPEAGPGLKLFRNGVGYFR